MALLSSQVSQALRCPSDSTGLCTVQQAIKLNLWLPLPKKFLVFIISLLRILSVKPTLDLHPTPEKTILT
jgi:hypothetical protein